MPTLADVLAPAGIVPLVASAWPKPNGMPCCSMVAMAILAANDRAPDESPHGLPVGLGAWRRASPQGWWEMANIWEGQHPWSSLDAAQHFYPGGELRIQESGRHPLPALTPGRWHVVQDWRLDLRGGHTYLVHLAASGEPYYGGTAMRLVQSSVAQGYRDWGWSRWPRKDERMVGVLTLPEGA